MANFGSVLASDRINLEKIDFLLIDPNHYFLDIMAQVITGFGARNITRCTTADQARTVLAERVIDFILTDANMPDESGYDFIEWVRRNASEANRFVPAIIVTGHTRISQVARARDCGAHFIVAKPITPKVILERIFWVGRENRMFIESDSYCGLDRRFKTEGPPEGMLGRRAEDLDAFAAEAGGPDSEDLVSPIVAPKAAQ
jgi:response regulator RpfG family c-di-GMP phosphodiesterase